MLSPINGRDFRRCGHCSPVQLAHSGARSSLRGLITTECEPRHGAMAKCASGRRIEVSGCECPGPRDPQCIADRGALRSGYSASPARGSILRAEVEVAAG